MTNAQKFLLLVRNVPLVCLALLLALPASGEIYRTVDAAGNITYTDQPPPSSGTANPGVITEGVITEGIITEKIEVHTPNTFVEAKPQDAYEPWIPDAEEAAASYQSLVITSPTNDASFRENAGNVTISTDLRPGLHSGDALYLEMDGALGDSPVDGFDVQLTNVPRGTHRIRMVVVGSDGTRKIESAEKIFHLQRYSVNQNRANN